MAEDEIPPFELLGALLYDADEDEFYISLKGEE